MEKKCEPTPNAPTTKQLFDLIMGLNQEYEGARFTELTILAVQLFGIDGEGSSSLSVDGLSAWAKRKLVHRVRPKYSGCIWGQPPQLNLECT